MTDNIAIPREQLQRMVSAIDMLIPTLPGLNDKGRTWLRDEIIESTDALRAALDAEPAPVQEPVAWSMTYNGDHCGNFYESRTDAEERMADMNAKHPLDKRTIEPLYPAPQPAPVQELSHDVVAGAIFDFAGFLTSHKDKIEAGSSANAGPMVERIREWSGKRGLSLENPDVSGWQMRAVQPSKAVKLSDDEIIGALNVADVTSAQTRDLFLSDARAIEAAVWAKLGVEPCQ